MFHKKEKSEVGADRPSKNKLIYTIESLIKKEGPQYNIYEKCTTSK